MDFGRAVVDALGSDVGLHQLEREFLGHAHGAVELHGVVEDVVGHLGGVGLDHRDVGADVHVVVELPGGLVGHQRGGADARRGICDPVLDGLAFGEGRAEGGALGGVVEHHVERALGCADAP